MEPVIEQQEGCYNRKTQQWETWEEDGKLKKVPQKMTCNNNNNEKDVDDEIVHEEFDERSEVAAAILTTSAATTTTTTTINKKQLWETSEDQKLIRLVQKSDGERTKEVFVNIARQLEGRNWRQCRYRWYYIKKDIRGITVTSSNKPWDIKKRSKDAEVAAEVAAIAENYYQKNYYWTTTEDNTLNVLVNDYGTEWTEIAKYMPGREEDAIKKRWNYIGTTWSELEDNKLKKLFRTYGNVRRGKWDMIVKNMPGRSKTALELRWYSRLKKEVEAEEAEEEAAEAAAEAAEDSNIAMVSSSTNSSLDSVMEETNDDGEQEQEQECSSVKSCHYQPDNSLLKKPTPHDILKKKNHSTKVAAKKVIHRKIIHKKHCWTDPTIPPKFHCWTEAEDRIFFQRVQKYDTGLPKQWVEIASHIEGKTPKQCQDHWQYKLKKYKMK